MAIVLIVDDSAVDRCLVGEYLQEDADLRVDFAANGREALAKLAQDPVDLILTDLMMPEIDGLELVGTVRRDYPLVPVILMTSQGNEEIAVQALHAGAASYVSKQMLHRKLLETVHRVLAVASRRRCHSRLMECMTDSRFTFTLNNDCALFTPLIVYLQETASQMGICNDGERTRIGVALEEALANALYHGNLEIDSQLRDDDQAYYALVEDRMGKTPYRNRRLNIEVSLSRDKAVFVIRDEGRGFDPTTLPDPTDPANLEKASGRGILLMRMFMDEVAFNSVGNVVTLVKYVNGNGSLSQPTAGSASQ